MIDKDKQEIRSVVQDELLGILRDAREALGSKDPTGFAKKALDGLSSIIRKRQAEPPGGAFK